MVRRRNSAVSNHDARCGPSFETRRKRRSSSDERNSRSRRDEGEKRRDLRRRQKNFAGGTHRLVTTRALAALLDGRARHGAVGTEHTTIARLGFELFAATFADVEKLASIGGHRFGGLKAASWTGQCGFKLHAAILLVQLKGRRQIGQPLRRCLDQRRLYPFVGPADDRKSDHDEGRPKQPLAEFSRRHQAHAEAHQARPR
jgi:hypothetical protein